MACDMLVVRELGQGSLKLLSIQVQCVVIDVLGGVFESSKQKIDLAQISAKSVSECVPDYGGKLVEHLPTPELDDHGTLGNPLCNAGRRVLQDFDLIIGQVVFIQVRDLASR